MIYTFPSSLQVYRLLQWVGGLVIGAKVVLMLNFILRKAYRQVREICGCSYFTNVIGKWAVITGGTDGIGKAYADELAQKGFSICLISRNVEKLNLVAKALEQNYKVDTKTINVDFTAGQEIYRIIENKLQQLEGGIGVLVNNVGMSYKYAEYFHAVPDGMKFMMDMIYSNIASCTIMMKIVMPLMRKNKGVIINISSLLGVYPMPLLATYAACKVYVDYLSRAVQYEYNNSGIIIQSVLPGYVATKMSKRRPTLEVPSAKTFVSSAIKTVGYESYTYGYIAHKIRGFVHEWLKNHMPTCVNMKIASHIMIKNREKYYKKQRKLEQK